MNAYARNGEPALSEARKGDMTRLYTFTVIENRWVARIDHAISACTYIGLYTVFIIWLAMAFPFWLFLFGMGSALALLGRYLLMLETCRHSFSTKQDLMTFVEGLPDDNK